MKRVISLLLVASLAFGLTACYTVAPPASNVVQRGSVVDGQWVDANGIKSYFNNGHFETRAGDTNEKLSEGNYSFRSAQLIELEMRSLVRGTVSRVNCAIANNATQLLCTSEAGSRFALNRR